MASRSPALLDMNVKLPKMVYARVKTRTKPPRTRLKFFEYSPGGGSGDSGRQQLTLFSL